MAQRKIIPFPKPDVPAPQIPRPRPRGKDLGKKIVDRFNVLQQIVRLAADLLEKFAGEETLHETGKAQIRSMLLEYGETRVTKLSEALIKIWDLSDSFEQQIRALDSSPSEKRLLLLALWNSRNAVQAGMVEYALSQNHPRRRERVTINRRL
jgi:hypothetical protein